MSFEHCGSKLHETCFFDRKKSSENFREHFFELLFPKFFAKSSQNLKILFNISDIKISLWNNLNAYINKFQQLKEIYSLKF